MPTRAGRFGRAFVSGEKPFINVRNSQYQSLYEPLDQNCGCLACRHYSLGYIHHLFHCEEMLGPQLVSIHNLRHYLSLMERIRAAIAGSTFEDLYRAESARWVDVEKVENDEIDAD
jgi:queuine tRNA-ribosyltransferase